eukprot:TRINITY_DN11262_c0_g1_i1.p1 TRINITY_DN11262_c0_g1~~TRINITY_DN11262_c0_g1_i1.p1  ORF type:complete len:400 (+),score=73.50 TRINITY_DN11262_c0_g1_i1:69-1268(+)
MSNPRESVCSSFLIAVHEEIKSHASSQCLRAEQKCIIVLGNEAADTDSVVSALSFATLLWLENGQSFQSVVPIPVVNFPRQHFAIQVETVRLLKEMGIEPSNLFYYDDAFVQESLKSEHTMLALTDHNKLTMSQSHLKDKIVTVIDHHVDEKIHYKEKDIQLVGSCCTLIAKRWLQKSTLKPFLDPTTATLLCAVISVDCVGLAPEMKKVTATDLSVIDQLEPIATLTRSQTIHWSTRLSQWRTDISSLTTDQIFRKDYKLFMYGSESQVTCGITSIRLDWPSLSNKESGFARVVFDFIAEQKLNVLVLMLSYWEPKTGTANPEKIFQRQLICFSLDAGMIKRMEEFLLSQNVFTAMTDINPSLRQDLVQSGLSVCKGLQTDVGFTRKQLQPLLGQHFL